MTISFPGESAKYRAARDPLLEQEVELRPATEALAVARRALPPGGAIDALWNLFRLHTQGARDRLGSRAALPRRAV